MGLGDWIMATAQARDLNEATGKRVLVVGQAGRTMWSEVFENNPRIVRRPCGPDCTILRNGPGMRPYIVAKQPHRWIWKSGTLTKPGELFLTEAETRFAMAYHGRVLIEPHTKVADGNKAWPWERWEAVVESLPTVRFVQVGPFNTRVLHNVEFVPTTFRQAAAMLSVAAAFVGTEGALHHAAAALKIPSVVLWSEFISPEVTGYATQRNLRHAGDPCGARVPCVGCKISMGLISAEEVVNNLKELLQ